MKTPTQRISVPVDEVRLLLTRAERINWLSRENLMRRELTRGEWTEIAEDSAAIVSELENRLARWDVNRRLT